MNQLFQSFQRILGTAESVEFTIRQHKKGLEVIVTPTLKEAPTDLSDEDAEFRGALATTLYAREDASVLDEQFFAQLAEFAEIRESLANTCGAIDTLREADKQAKAAKKKLGSNKGADKSEVSADDRGDSADQAPTTESVPEPVAAKKENPDSLF